MSRSPIQVPDDIKERMEGFKDKLHVKSLHELINRLMDSHMENERLRREEVEKRGEEKKRQEIEDVHLGHDLKESLTDVSKSLELRLPETIEFLIKHYDNSDQIGKPTFNFYKMLQHR